MFAVVEGGTLVAAMVGVEESIFAAGVEEASDKACA